MIPVGANGQPALAGYMHASDAVYRAHAIQVLTITPSGLSRVVSFNDPGLFATFGLPEYVSAVGSTRPSPHAPTRNSPSR